MTTVAARYDPMDAATLDNPYPVYAALRAAGRVCRGGPGQWVVTRYDDVAALLHDARLGHQFPAEYRRFSLGDGPASTFFQRIVLEREPPEHTRLRRLLGVAFTSQAVHQRLAYIGDTVDRLMQPALERGHLDAVADLAFPLPVTVACELIGIPEVDHDEIRPRAIDLSRAFGTYVPEADRPLADRAVEWLRDYMGRLVEERSRRPRGDLLSHLLAAEQGTDRLTREEIVDNAVFLLFAGFETTMNLIATGCALLIEHPEALRQLRADASLMPTAIEEMLRYDAPIQSAARLVLSPVTIGDRTIRADRVIVLLLGSANHDERQFADAERFDIARRPNLHVTFGGGIHYCLGAVLARLEASVAFSRLLRRVATLEPAGTPIRRRSAGFRSYAAVPISVTPVSRT